MSSSSPVRDGLVRGITLALTLVVSVIACMVLAGVFVFAVSFGLGAGMATAGRSTVGSIGYVHLSGNAESNNKLLAVRVEGPILGSPPRDHSAVFLLGGFTFGYEVQQVLEDAARKSEIKGVLLHLQTPGGTIFGSRAIHDGVVAYRERTKKPVVAYVEGLAASGGVMAMVGATKIYADYGSMIGSIGVLGPQLLFFNRPVATDGGLLSSGVVTQGGIEQTIIAAGRGKDLGNPFRRPTEEEVATLKRGVDAEYEQFVRHVAHNRHIDAVTIREDMGAMVFDNSSAKEFGLIDDTASRGDTIARLAELAGVGKDYEIVRPGEDNAGLVRRILSAMSAIGEPRVEMSPKDVLRAELCAPVRMPLAFYGDLASICR
jgi:protease-4